jgi:hypothetical protein
MTNPAVKTVITDELTLTAIATQGKGHFEFKCTGPRLLRFFCCKCTLKRLYYVHLPTWKVTWCPPKSVPVHWQDEGCDCCERAT